MSVQQDSPAVAVARAHVEAWSNHDFETACQALAEDVWVTATTIDPAPPKTDLVGIEGYMRGLIAFAQAVVPGSAEVLASTGDERRALLMLTVQARFGPDSPELTLPERGSTCSTRTARSRPSM
jgi:SnoaL-like protein